ncbi:MAG: hypothetical protein U5L00_03420 [Desulfovermiculus sp.]|nr:hypothetical protein [Desulfovermiculus sp.]
MRFRHFILHLTGLVPALVLTIDILLQFTQAKSLCQTQACQAVGEYVRLGETNLLILGAAFFWVVWLLFFLSTRLNRPVFWHLAALVLLAALAFDGGLLGYQFMGLGLQCWLCVGVGAALFANLFSLAWVRKGWMIACIGVVVWMGGFAANSALIVAPQAPQLQEAAFVSHNAPKDNPDIDFYFFFSLNCGHCTEIIINMAMNGQDKVNWHLCSLDSTDQNIRKLAWVKEQVEQGADPFVQILKAKGMKDVPVEEIPDAVQQAVGQAQAFFRHRGYRGVPLLVVQQGRNQELTLTGKSNIARFLWEQGVVTKWMQPDEAMKRLRGLRD